MAHSVLFLKNIVPEWKEFRAFEAQTHFRIPVVASLRPLGEWNYRLRAVSYFSFCKVTARDTQAREQRARSLAKQKPKKNGCSCRLYVVPKLFICNRHEPMYNMWLFFLIILVSILIMALILWRSQYSTGRDLLRRSSGTQRPNVAKYARSVSEGGQQGQFFLMKILLFWWAGRMFAHDQCWEIVIHTFFFKL